ncbi:DUF4439 domain-containing protein [Naumannella sp. ID2617S]|nr:DUF4439 domain-containing protein [Naumannella sp. ID2617S]
MSTPDRRGFLAVAGGSLLALTGCMVSDPRVVGGPSTPPPQPSPSPLPTIPGQQLAIGSESELAALCGQLNQSAAALGLPAGQGTIAGWLAAGHKAHLIALVGVRPNERPTAVPTPDARWSPRPMPTPSLRLPGDRAQAVRTITDLLGRCVGPYRESALASSGTTALLWGSLTAYAIGAGIALPGDPGRPAPPSTPNHPLAPMTEVEAPQQLLRQVHALVYGYQVAIASLPRPEAQRATELLGARRTLRGDLTALIRGRGQTAPAAEAAYALSVQPRDAATARELLSRMELAFAPFAGAWVAAATDPDSRRKAQQVLEESVRVSLGWGAPLPIWPGWPL